jgi:hypothetical protein
VKCQLKQNSFLTILQPKKHLKHIVKHIHGYKEPKKVMKTRNQCKTKKFCSLNLPYKASSREKTLRINSPHRKELTNTKITPFVVLISVNDDFLSSLLEFIHFLSLLSNQEKINVLKFGIKINFIFNYNKLLTCASLRVKMFLLEK